MQDDILGWQSWAAEFQGIDEISSPSELHGLLTGIVCITQAPSAEQWQIILSSLQVAPLAETALQRLTEEAEDVAHALADEELDYIPMLPDDEHDLKDRVQALADWCAGVVLGFGLASGHIRPDELEWIQHLQDVAAVEFEDDDNDEEGEESYQELYEFVRLIPVSLAVGRKKVPVQDTSLLKQADPAVDTHNIVEMFAPERPS